MFKTATYETKHKVILAIYSTSKAPISVNSPIYSQAQKEYLNIKSLKYTILDKAVVSYPLFLLYTRSFCPLPLPLILLDGINPAKNTANIIIQEYIKEKFEELGPILKTADYKATFSQFKTYFDTNEEAFFTIYIIPRKAVIIH